MANQIENLNGIEIKIIPIQEPENKEEIKQCQNKTSKLKNKFVALLLAMCLCLLDSTPLLGGLVSIALSQEIEENIKVNSQITKYIPYAYTEEDKGVIIQQKINMELPQEIENVEQANITVKFPAYAEINPEKVELRTENGLLSEDNTQNIYYKMDNENNQAIISQKENTNKEIYITYFYPADAYDKYLETTHVNEYPDGELVSVEKDEETGEVWAYIDFAWDPEENEGEMPSNKHLVDKLPISLKTNLEIKTKEETITKEYNQDLELDINKKDIIDNTLSSNITEFSKSNIYTNKEMNYEIKNVLNIVRSDVLNIITLQDLGTHFISENDNINIAKIRNNSLSISKTNFEEILGEEGFIRILNSNYEEIGKIDSNLEANGNGDYVYTFEDEIETVNLEISDIKNDGFLIFNQSKTILKDQDYSKEQEVEFKTIRTANYIESTDINNYTHNMEQTVEISLLETYTNANLTLNNTNLSTIDENTGIEFKIELKNNNGTSDLWANPFIILEMPQEVENIKINGSSLLYGGGITLHSADIIDLNGNKAIKLVMVGEQEDFISDSIVGGTTIVVNADIKLKDLTPTSQNKPINMYYFNSNKTNYENSTNINLDGEDYEVGLLEQTFNYIAPIEFKTITKISEFNENGSIISSENSEKEVGKIGILEPEKAVKQSIILMNNTGNEATQVKAIGRIPFAGNTDIISNEELGTTNNAYLTDLIKYTGSIEKEIKIYYSENGNADTDLSKAENAWKENPENLQNVKTFMIVIENVAQGEKLLFEYNLKIPGMLEHGEYLYSSLATYYTNNTEVGPVAEVSKANTVGLSTGIGARAKIELSAGIDTLSVLTEGQKVKYTLKVSNTGELPAENVVVTNPIPKGTSYIEETVVKNDIETFNKYTYYSSSNELQWSIGTIMPGQVAELEYTVVVDNVPSILEYYGMQEGFTEEDGKYYIISTNPETGETIKTEITNLPDIIITNKAILKSDNIEKEIYSNELPNKVLTSYFDILEEVSVEKAVYLQELENYTYTVIIENKTDLQMQNLEVTKIIPEGITYKQAEILTGEGNINYDEATRKLTITSNTLGAYETKEINIQVQANKLPDGVYKKEIITNTSVKADGIEANTSSSVTNTIAKPKISATITCDVKQRYIYEKDILNYTITVTNENDMTAANLSITNIIPEGTKFVNGSYTRNGNEYTVLANGSNEILVETNLTNETIVINIKVQVERIEADVEELEIVNKATLKANNVDEYEIGQIKHTVIKTSGQGPGGDDTDPGTGEGTGGGSGDNPGSGSGENPGGGTENPGGPIGGETGSDGKVRYKLKGSVWNDLNKDGERQDDEDTITGVTVYLINKNGDIIKDYETGEEKISVTDIDGEYEFRNVESGEYMVVFIYDNNNYNITEYQKLGVVNDRNSDAILKTIELNGQTKEAAVTDIIEVTNRSLYSVDLGLTDKDKFNLELQAGISNITVKTNKETKQIPYNMEDLAKVEIRASQIGSATVVIEYNLKITNNSDIPGSVTQLMATKPNGLTFSSSANNDWYEGNDKNLYLSGLTNEIINPGQSVDVKLTLVKQMTGSNTGTIENNFTITKTYNEKGVTEDNLEDNSKSVTCIIATSTGTTVAYTGISILALSAFSIGIYFIRKRLTKEKRWI